MTSAYDDGWWNELKKYWCKIENQTKLSLQMIKRDRIRSGLPFDEKFKNNFLRTAYEKIGGTFEQFLKDENCIVQCSSDIRVGQRSQEGTCDNNRNPNITARYSPNAKPNNQSSGSTSGLQNAIDQTNTLKSRKKSLKTQQTEDVDQSAGQQSRSAANKLGVLQEPAMIVPDNPNNGQQMQPVVLSSNTEDSGRITVVEDCERARQDSDDELTGEQAHYDEIIDLISDQEEEEEGTASHHVNCITKGMENEAGSSQLVTEPQNEISNDVNVGGHLKKKYKLTNAVGTKKRFQCDHCPYSTMFRTNLKDHIRTHTGERPYECVVCEKRFTMKHHLYRHTITHRGMFAFQCSNCYLGFSDENQWKLHENSCKSKRYECHLCKRTFIEKRNLFEHMRRHTGEKLRCSKCRKQLSSDRGLTEHMKLHGNLFPFQCPKCRLGFSQQTPWKMHATRCKAKQFECYVCRKKFYQRSSNLLRHIRYNHTGEKPFGCSHCHERFCQKSNLEWHMKRHHH